MKGKKYVQGEKVFAKVRGYPAWPARIVGAADEASNANKIRYHIHFYGTGETAIVKGEDMYPYILHRNGKMGKPRKQKGFNDAMKDIEEQLTAEEKEQIANHPGDNEGADVSIWSDDGSGNASIGRVSVGTKTPKANTPDTPKSRASVQTEGSTSTNTPSETKSNKRKTTAESEPESKKAKVDNESNDEESSSQKTNVTSRAGRKIKQKKFSDEPSELESAGKPKPAAPKQKSQPKSDGSSVKEDDDFIEFIYQNESVKIPLKSYRPTFTNPKSPVTWDRLVLQQAYDLKDQVMSGEVAPDKVVKVMEDWCKSKAVDMASTFEEDDQICAALKTEGKLLSLDFKIKSALTLNKADTGACLQHFEEMLSLPLTQVMLKKHPEVIETIKRLRRYVGNTSIWNYSEEDLKEFKEAAEKIRTKADHIFSKFEGLFIIPPGKTFWTVFSKQLEEFHKKTENLTEESVFLITKEPF